MSPMPVLNFALDGAQQISSSKGHLWIKCKFVLEPYRKHHSKSTGHHGSYCGCRGLIRGLPIVWMLIAKFEAQVGHLTRVQKSQHLTSILSPGNECCSKHTLREDLPV